MILRLHGGTTGIMWRYLRDVLPAVDDELAQWRRAAEQIPCPNLRQQALASIQHKKFHCQGGAIYVAGRGEYRKELLRFIVALQTISDYLDNLCDRAAVVDGAAFRQLHQAMLDAVTPPVDDRAQTFTAAHNGHTLAAPEKTNSDYYVLYPFQNDGGYLAKLVMVCRGSLAQLPGYTAVKEHVCRLVTLYNDLQVYKHITLSERVPQLTTWFQREWPQVDELLWQEFAAACGSTLGVFSLCHAACKTQSGDPKALLNLYFPWMASWHILLDYFIDLAEDRAGGDLNFVSFYPNLDEAERRMLHLYRQAMSRVRDQEEPALHNIALHGLPALYLSDVKVTKQGQQLHAMRMVRTGGARAVGLHALCRLYRRMSPNMGGVYEFEDSVSAVHNALQ